MNAFLIEPIDDGERAWTTIAEPYITLPTDRDRITVAIQEMTWYPIPALIPFTQGLLLQGLLRDFDMRKVAQVGISSTPLKFPENDHIDRYPHNINSSRLHLATCSVVGIQRWRPTGWLRSYFLDTGTEARGLAVDHINATHPPGVTIACVTHQHDKCPGTARYQHKPSEACRCYCGCTSRT